MKKINLYSNISTEKIQDQFKLGNTILYRLFYQIYGPSGKNILVDSEKSSGPIITKNSFEILKQLRTESNFENFVFLIFQDGFQKLQFFSSQELTSYFLISCCILVEGWKNIIEHYDTLEINLGIEKTINFLINRLNEISQPLNQNNNWKLVLRHYLAEEKEILSLIDKTTLNDGKFNQVKIDCKLNQKLELKIQRGMNINYGYFSPYFVTNSKSMVIEFESPLILLTTTCLNLDNLKIKKILEPVIERQQPLVIISPDIKEETLQSLILNKVNGIVDIAYIKIPQLFNTNSNAFKDLAFYSNATLIESESDWKAININDLGSLDKITINKSKTTLWQKNNIESNEIEKRCNQIKQQALISNSDYDNERLTERQRNLSGYTATLHVGAKTTLETIELESRIRQAFLSTESCLYEGIVPKLEIVSLIFDEEIENWARINCFGASIIGNKIVKKALIEPTKLSIEKLTDSNSLNSQKFLEILKSLRKSNGIEIEEKNINKIIDLGFYDSFKSIQAGLKLVSSLTQSILSIEKSLL